MATSGEIEPHHFNLSLHVKQSKAGSGLAFPWICWTFDYGYFYEEPIFATIDLVFVSEVVSERFLTRREKFVAIGTSQTEQASNGKKA